MGLYILCEGALYDEDVPVSVEVIFRRWRCCNPRSPVDGKRLAEAGDLQVLEDDTYGSVILRRPELQPAYAA